MHFLTDKITTLRIVIEDETETEYSALPRREYAVYYNLFSDNNNCNIASCPFCEILHLEWITKLSGFLQLDTIDRLVGTKIAFCHIE